MRAKKLRNAIFAIFFVVVVVADREDRKVIVKRLDDFREKTQHQLATTLDP